MANQGHKLPADFTSFSSPFLISGYAIEKGER